MRAYILAVVVVVVVLGGAWLVLALGFGHSLNSGSDAYLRSATCVRHDRSLANDPAEATRYSSAGLQPLAIRWQGVRAVALFSDSLSPDSVDRADARIISRLTSKGVSPPEISKRLLHQDNLSSTTSPGHPHRPRRRRSATASTSSTTTKSLPLWACTSRPTQNDHSCQAPTETDLAPPSTVTSILRLWPER